VIQPPDIEQVNNYIVVLIVWHARTNSLWTIPLDVIENDKCALGFALHVPLGKLLLCLRVITLNPALVTSDNHGQEGCIVGGDLTKLLADVTHCYFWSALRNWLKIKWCKKSTPPPSSLQFCTLTPKICYYYLSPLYRVITTAVQMASPVPEIMDTTSYIWIRSKWPT
jgi:hypothetical protein